MTPTVSDPPPGFLAYASFRRFTLDEYHRMIRAGVLVDGEPFELIEGYMVRKMPRGTPHDDTLDLAEGEFQRLVPAGWFVRTQRAVTLTDSEPEPDLAVVRGPRGRYRASHPTPGEIGLIAEVAASSLPFDRVDKARAYARSGVAVYWVIDVAGRRIEVLTGPSGPTTTPGYAAQAVFGPGQSVPVELDGTAVGSIAVDDVLPGVNPSA